MMKMNSTWARLLPVFNHFKLNNFERKITNGFLFDKSFFSTRL